MSVTRKWFLGVAACIVVVSVATICGCTSVAEIRTVHEPRIIQQSSMTPYTPNVGCESSSSTANDRLNSIEDYVAGDAPAAARSGSDFWAGYVEFDDEGWMYDKDQSRANKLNQLDTVMSRLQRELKDPAYAKDDFLVVAFVHGWHHNANDTDCNVHEFRSMLQIANKRYDLSGLGHRRIVGIYVGWRGESIDVNYLNVTTVLDRRNAAERVAKGDVRELFAQLRAMQIGAAAASIESSDGDVVKPHPDRMRTVVIGHSFGGLIAFHGLSPAVLNELTPFRVALPSPSGRSPAHRQQMMLHPRRRTRGRRPPSSPASRRAPTRRPGQDRMPKKPKRQLRLRARRRCFPTCWCSSIRRSRRLASNRCTRSCSQCRRTAAMIRSTLRVQRSSWSRPTTIGRPAGCSIPRARA
jgi:hypothetical protein